MTDTITDRCERCDRGIELRPISTKELSYRWYAGSGKDSWRCGNDPDFPVRSHSPKRTILPENREADRHHDFESSRGDGLPDGPCAVCGRHKEEWAHQ